MVVMYEKISGCQKKVWLEDDCSKKLFCNMLLIVGGWGIKIEMNGQDRECLQYDRLNLKSFKYYNVSD